MVAESVTHVVASERIVGIARDSSSETIDARSIAELWILTTIHLTCCYLGIPLSL